MKIILDRTGRMDIAGLNSGTTVSDFFTAIDSFTAERPLPCRECRTNCCDRRFFIEMDAVSAMNLSQGNLERFINDHLKIDYSPNDAIRILLASATERCQYLNAMSECSVYEHRPASCRTYTCRPRSRSYDILDSVVAAALQHAMIAAYFEILAAASPQWAESLEGPLEWLKATPAYGKTHYHEIALKDCIRFDMDGSNLSSEEAAAYGRLAAMEEL